MQGGRERRAASCPPDRTGRRSSAGSFTAAKAGETPHNGLYVSLSRLRIDPQRAPQLVVAFRGRAHLVDDADGFIDLQVWQSDRDASEIVMVSRWRDRKASPRTCAHKRTGSRTTGSIRS